MSETLSTLALDPLVPQRDLLLDESHMLQRFRSLIKNESLDNCRLLRAKYRPVDSIRVLYSLDIGGKTLRVACRTFSPDRARPTEFNGSSSIFLDNELSTVFWIFPNDRKIRHLSALISGGLQKINGTSWTRSRLVAYAPEKSATAQLLDDHDHVVAYAKVYASDEGRLTNTIHHYLQAKVRETKSSLKVSRALTYSEEHSTLLTEVVDGDPLANLTDERLADAFFHFGASLAALHDLPAPGFIHPFKRLRVDAVVRAARVIAQCRPDLASRAIALAEKLTGSFQRNELPEVLLHGDVHPKNAIVANGSVTLIDLDQVGIGSAAADLGSLIAALEYERCVGQTTDRQTAALMESCLAGYASRKQLPAKQSLNWHTAAALVEERALRAISRVRVNGLEHMDQLLRRATEVLERQH